MNQYKVTMTKLLTLHYNKNVHKIIKELSNMDILLPEYVYPVSYLGNTHIKILESLDSFGFLNKNIIIGNYVDLSLYPLSPEGEKYYKSNWFSNNISNLIAIMATIISIVAIAL